MVDAVREIYGYDFVPLHRPVFAGAEKANLAACIDSNFVSSVGEKVTAFEASIAAFTGSRFAVATVNGTAALHVGLILAGVERGDEVISQALTFVATCNAISYIGAHPVFVDVDRETMGLGATALKQFLSATVRLTDGRAYNRVTGRRIAACVPMHSFGLACEIEEIADLCAGYGIPVVEDAAESLGSYVGKRHTGTFGLIGTYSFNGNKIITTGGGGMIVTDDEIIARRAKHLTTTAKTPHPYEFVHDEVGFNYRMPNLNAALGCAQMDQLPGFLRLKRAVADYYHDRLADIGAGFIKEREGTRANYWLNALCLPDAAARDAVLNACNDAGVMTRPVWRLMSSLPMFRDCMHDGLEVSRWLEKRIVNIPSSVPDAVIADGPLGPYLA
ncbi:aminotransferase DegT [Sphingomonas sp. SRS2]|nr:aminotransferase DegT [Sphingomonas sp. SRS2]